MLQLELPHVSVLSKMDLLKERRSHVERFLLPDVTHIFGELQASMGPRFHRLNESMASLVRFTKDCRPL